MLGDMHRSVVGCRVLVDRVGITRRHCRPPIVSAGLLILLILLLHYRPISKLNEKGHHGGGGVYVRHWLNSGTH